jgi:hypothetical protein
MKAKKENEKNKHGSTGYLLVLAATSHRYAVLQHIHNLGT